MEAPRAKQDRQEAVTLEQPVTRLIKNGEMSIEYFQMLLRVFGKEVIEGYVSKCQQELKGAPDLPTWSDKRGIVKRSED